MDLLLASTPRQTAAVAAGFLALADTMPCVRSIKEIADELQIVSVSADLDILIARVEDQADYASDDLNAEVACFLRGELACVRKALDRYIARLAMRRSGEEFAAGLREFGSPSQTLIAAE